MKISTFFCTHLVGASQSHGDRVAGNVKGIDNLAAFSSRGPTYDGEFSHG